MLNMPVAPSSAMDRLVLWLCRSPTLGFAISRVTFAVAASWQMGAMFSNETGFARTAFLLQTGIWIWTIASIARHLATPPLGKSYRRFRTAVPIDHEAAWDARRHCLF